MLKDKDDTHADGVSLEMRVLAHGVFLDYWQITAWKMMQPERRSGLSSIVLSKLSVDVRLYILHKITGLVRHYIANVWIKKKKIL